MSVKKQILVIYPDEISACIAQFPWLASDADWLCLTIDAFNECLQLGIPNARMPNWLRAVSMFSVVEQKEHYFRLQELEEVLMRQRHSMGFKSAAYWNHQHNSFMLNVLSSVKKTAELAAKHLLKTDQLLIPHRAGVGDYHFSGGLSSAIVAQVLRESGFNVKLVDLPISLLSSQYHPAVYDVVPDFWSIQTSGAWLASTANTLICPSGLFYKQDQQKLVQLLEQLGCDSLSWMISPAFWNVFSDGPGFKSRIPVGEAWERMSDGTKITLTNMADRMTMETEAVFIELLGPKIGGLDCFSSQIQRLQKRHLYQCMIFLGACHLGGLKPMDALIVGHLDGGTNGPLLSAAIETEAPCYMVPHSRVINLPTEDTCTVVTEYWQPKPSRSHRGEINPVIYCAPRDGMPSGRDPLETLRGIKVLILFNGIHRWTSTNVSFDFLAEAVLKIRETCKELGVDPAYRLKPGDQTPIGAYRHLLDLGIEDYGKCLDGDLDKILSDTELVISVDTPSTAIWGALERGCAVLLIANRPFVDSELLDAEGNLVAYSLEQGIELLRELLTDPAKLDDLRGSQFGWISSLRANRLSPQ